MLLQYIGCILIKVCAFFQKSQLWRFLTWQMDEFITPKITS